MNQEALFVIFDNIGPFVLSFFRLLQKFKFDDKTKPWAAHRDRLLRPLGTISMAVTHSRRRLAVGRQIKFKDIWFQFFLDLSISLFPSYYLGRYLCLTIWYGYLSVVIFPVL